MASNGTPLPAASNSERGERSPYFHIHEHHHTAKLHYCIHDDVTSHTCFCGIQIHHDENGYAVPYERIM